MNPKNFEWTSQRYKNEMLKMSHDARLFFNDRYATPYAKLFAAISSTETLYKNRNMIFTKWIEVVK